MKPRGAMRIVSLLPSATDITCVLGLRDQLVGRTHECDWPPGIDSVAIMTRSALATSTMSSREIDRAVGASAHSGSSIYALEHEALAAARPDLILTQELCDVCAVSYEAVTAAARMMDIGPRVVSLEPSSLEDIFSNIRTVGALTGTEDQARSIVEELRNRLEDVREAVRDRERPTTACLEWLDPVYDAGHWVPEQVDWAGGTELIGRRRMRSRVVEWDAILGASPEVIVIMPCGFGVERSKEEAGRLLDRPGWSSLPAVRAGRVWVVDGAAYFDRPGPRTVRGVEVLAHILHGMGEVSPAEAAPLAS